MVEGRSNSMLEALCPIKHLLHAPPAPRQRGIATRIHTP